MSININYKTLKKILTTFFISFIVFLIVCFLHNGKYLNWLENKIDDYRIKYRPRDYMPILSDPVLIGIDDESLAHVGRWPWNRAVFAEFLKFIKRANPRAVLFDIEFLEKFPGNSIASRYQLFDTLEVWYEGMPDDLKIMFNSESEEAIIKLTDDYLNYKLNPRPFAKNVDDDYYFAKSLKLLDKAYLAMHFAEELTLPLRKLAKLDPEEYNRVMSKVPLESRELLNYDVKIYKELIKNVASQPSAISLATGIDENYIKGKIFDLRKQLVENYVYDNYSEAVKITSEVSFNDIRTKVFKNLNITSEIDLIKDNIFMGMDEIIAKRIKFLDNLSYTHNRDYYNVSDSVHNALTRAERGTELNIPIEELFKNAHKLGFSNSEPDDDGIFRRHPVLIESEGKFIPSLALQAANDIMGFDLKNASFTKDGLLVIPFKNEKIQKNMGRNSVQIPIDLTTKTAFFNWAADYEENNAFTRLSFYTHFYNLMEIENQAYKFISENLIASANMKMLGEFLRIYANIRENGLNEENISKLTPIIDSIITDLNDKQAAIDKAYARPNLRPEQIDRLKKRANDIYMTLFGLNSFKKNVIGKDNLIDSLKNKFLIVGLSANATSDIKATPVSPKTPMFFGHANIINAILQNKFIRRTENHHNIIILSAGGMLSFAILSSLNPVSAFIMITTSVVGFFYLTALLFFKTGILIAFMPFMIMLSLNFAVVTIFFYLYESREKSFLRHAFSHYLSQSIIEEIVNDPNSLKLKGEKRTLTVLFSDIRSFTTFSENHTPEEVVNMLNEYLDYMTEIIFKYNGTLDKYVGDEIMAVYGAPSRVIQEDHAARALFTSLEMMEVLVELQKKWIMEGNQPVDIGIGFNSGEMIVGNMGSRKHFDYTVIGDNVNLGARVEAATRQYTNHIIFTEFSLEYIKDLCEYRYLDSVKVKGKNKPVCIYEPIKLTPKGIEVRSKFTRQIVIDPIKKAAKPYMLKGNEGIVKPDLLKPAYDAFENVKIDEKTLDVINLKDKPKPKHEEEPEAGHEPKAEKKTETPPDEPKKEAAPEQKIEVKS